MVRATRQLTCVEPSDLSSGLPPTIWYMGAKTRVLPGFLDEVLLREAPRGSTVLDLFSGTGIVSAFCARHFRTLANDSQQFARILAQSFIEHTREERDAFLESLDWDRDLATAYEENRQALTEIYAAALEEEVRIARLAAAISSENKERELLAAVKRRRNGARRPVLEEGVPPEEGVLEPQLPRDDFRERLVAPVRVVQNQLPEPRPRHAPS